MTNSEHFLILLLSNLLFVSVRMESALMADSALPDYQYPSGSLACKLFALSGYDCSWRELTSIPPLPENITYADLAFNRINNISQTDFAGQHLLVILDIQSNNFSSIDGSPFEDLARLRALHLTYSFLERLSSTSFRGLFRLQQLFLRFNLLTSLPEDIFSDLSQLLLLDLGYNFLTEIPSQSVSPLHSLKQLHMFGNIFTSYKFGDGFANLTSLTHLYVHTTNLGGPVPLSWSSDVSISNCEVNVHLDNKTFEHLADIPLKRLDFLFDTAPNVTVSIDYELFSPLRSLEELTTSEGFEPTVDFVTSDLQFLKQFLVTVDRGLRPSSLQFASKFYDSITQLELSYSHIYKIIGPAFAEFSNLRVLNLTGLIYSLVYISDDAFYGLNKLEQLYLAHDEINDLPVRAFDAFCNGSLKTLDLSFNALTGAFVDDDPFQGVSASLTHLNLSYNPMSFVGSWLHSLTNLRELQLDSTTLTRFIYFDEWTFPLSSLTSFYFTWPTVPDVLKYQNEFFLSKKAPNLKTLSLAGTNLYSTMTIEDLDYLQYLDVSVSFTEFIDFDSLWGNRISFPRLETLRLRSNKLKSLDKMKLNETVPAVETLDIRDNLIQTVLYASLQYLSNLRILDLSNNRLLSLDGLLNIPDIEIIYVANNYISMVPITFVDTMMNRSLTEVDISGNPFSCSCSIEPFRDWIISDRSVLLMLQPHLQYQCKTPDNVAGESITQVVLDCESRLVFYISIGVGCVVLVILTTIIVVKFRWNIRYRLFLLFTWRRKYKPLNNNELQEDMNQNQLQYDCFVSYAHDDNEDLNWVLNDLAANLEEGEEPFRLCIGHARDFIPGTPLLEAITESIHKSRKTILVLSPSYLESEWCYFETQHAWLRLLNEGQDVLILILLKHIPDDKMTMWLRQFLCKKGYLTWPETKSAQDLFFQCLREIIKKPTAVDRRFDT